MNVQKSTLKVLIFIISYNHETLLTKVLERIPASLNDDERAEYHVLIIEDCSKDKTFEVGYDFLRNYDRFPTTLLSNPVNLGFGGNQKLGYQYAIENGYDHVVLVHGDGQYAPELIPDLIEPLLKGEADAVFGSRMLHPKEALRGGMPLYKWLGNKVLTGLENFLMGSNLSEWHSGFRLYSVDALKKIPFTYNSNYFDFDTHIIIQLLGLNLRIKELPIPTHYGDEECNVDGLRYARKIVLSCLLFRAQDLGIFYHPRFYLKERYEGDPERASFDSSVRRVVDKLSNARGRALLVTEAERHETEKALRNNGWEVDSVLPDYDFTQLPDIEGYYQHVVFMDTLESLDNPEQVLHALRHSRAASDAGYIAVGANVGFLPIRIMLLLGFFNYGVRGVLDFRHRRLFTLSSVRRLIAHHGYHISHTEGLPAPYRIALRSTRLADALSRCHRLFARLLPGLFSYQYLVEFHSLPAVPQLLASARSNTAAMVRRLSRSAHG